jgi:hypothetical protein
MSRSGRTVSLSGDYNFFGGDVSRYSPDVHSCEDVHSIDRENLVGGRYNRVISDTSVRGGENYLLHSKRGLTPLFFLSSRGLGLKYPKYLGPMTVGRKFSLKLAQKREIKEVNQGKHKFIKEALGVGLNPS